MNHRLPHFVVLIGFLLVSCGGKPPSVFDDFDKIITKKFLSGHLDSRYPIHYERNVEKDRITYIAKADFGEENRSSHAILSVTVSRGGLLLLSEEKYQEAKAAYRKQREDPKTAETMKSFPEEFFFPPIGARAWHGWSFGPGGGGAHCVFTTSDLKFDVDVDDSNHVGGAVAISKSSFTVARAICDAYDKRAKP